MFNFKVVTPEKTYLEGEASMVVLPGIEGDLGILPDHSNIITSIRPGFVNIDSTDRHQFFVEEGFIKFSENAFSKLKNSFLKTHFVKFTI